MLLKLFILFILDMALVYVLIVAWNVKPQILWWAAMVLGIIANFIFIFTGETGRKG